MAVGRFELVVVVVQEELVQEERVQDGKQSGIQIAYWVYWNVRWQMSVLLVVAVVRDDVGQLLCQTLNLHHLHDLFVVAEEVPYALSSTLTVHLIPLI